MAPVRCRPQAIDNIVSSLFRLRTNGRSHGPRCRCFIGASQNLVLSATESATTTKILPPQCRHNPRTVKKAPQSNQRRFVLLALLQQEGTNLYCAPQNDRGSQADGRKFVFIACISP